MKSGLMKKRSDDGPGEIDLTPMLDVVFILLIFFIVTSVFVTEAGIDVNRPQGSTGEPKAKDLILIAVSSDGEVWMNGEPLDPRFIRSEMELRLVDAPNSSVVIQGDENATNEMVMAIMRAAREAEIANVSISTEA